MLDAVGGFYTEEMIQQNRRAGFKIITLDGKEGILAKKGMDSSYRLGNYGIDIRDLESIGISAIRVALKAKDVVVIDEIAKMELFSHAFQEIVIEALDSPKTVLSVIQMSPLPFLKTIRSRYDVSIYYLKPDNQQVIFQQLKHQLNI